MSRKRSQTPTTGLGRAFAEDVSGQQVLAAVERAEATQKGMRQGRLPRIYLLLPDGARRAVSLPTPDATHGVVLETCPLCSSSLFRVSGTGRRPSKDDRAWEADAISMCCEKHVGVLRYETNTLFGVREDEAVLKGRCRVY